MLEDCDQKGEIHTDRTKVLEDWDPGGEIHTEGSRCWRTVTTIHTEGINMLEREDQEDVGEL